MRNAIIGIVIGVVVGIAVGTTIIAPRLPATARAAANGGQVTQLLPRVTDPSPKTQGTRWKMASAYASTLPQMGTLAKRVERETWRVSEGAFQIVFHEPSALVPPQGMFDAVASGAIDAAFASPGMWGEKVPALRLFSAVPFGPTPEEYLAWVYTGGGKELFDEIYHKRGIHSIFCGLVAYEAAGWFRNEIRSVKNLKGLKMRSSGLGSKVLKKLGVKTRLLNEGDIFLALESGAIDAASVSMPAVDFKLGIYKMAKHYYFPGWHQPSTFFDLMINLEKWQALPATRQAQIESMCGDNIRHSLAESESLQFAALKTMNAKGVQIHRWPTEILDALKISWGQLATEEANADKEFRRVWRSLTEFRRDYEIWKELGRP